MARRIAAFVMLVPLVLFGLYRCTWLPLRCSIDVARSESELVAAAESGDSYVKILAARAALGRLDDCNIRPLEVDPALLTALSFRFLEDHEASIAWYERALVIDRRPEIYLGLGLEQWKAGRREEGTRNLMLAVTFAPSILSAIDDGMARQEVQRRMTKAGQGAGAPPSSGAQ